MNQLTKQLSYVHLDNGLTRPLKSNLLIDNREAVNYILTEGRSICMNNSTSNSKCNSKCNSKERLKQEDNWGNEIFNGAFKTEKNQWTTKFSETFVKEVISKLYNEQPQRALKLNNLQPDLETNNFIIEVKFQKYFSTGTAWEKVLGVPLKYSGYPNPKNKKFLIVCCGQIEVIMKKKFKNFNQKQNKIIEFYKENGFEYVFFTDLLNRALNVK
jgi:hypothetical protein